MSQVTGIGSREKLYRLIKRIGRPISDKQCYKNIDDITIAVIVLTETINSIPTPLDKIV